MTSFLIYLLAASALASVWFSTPREERRYLLGAAVLSFVIISAGAALAN